MKKKNHTVIEASLKNTSDLRPGDICFFYPSYIYDVATGIARLFIKKASQCKLLRFSDDDHYAWIANVDGGEAVEVRRIQLTKAPEKKRVA